MCYDRKRAKAFWTWYMVEAGWKQVEIAQVRRVTPSVVSADYNLCLRMRKHPLYKRDDKAAAQRDLVLARRFAHDMSLPTAGRLR